MQQIWSRTALVGDDWQNDVCITIDGGRIMDVATGAEPAGHRADILVPAPANCHSHAFQRAMAGLTERRGPTADSFWTWRQMMFRFLDRLDPDQIEAITACVQMEMLEAGFACNVEFHYLHHGPRGAPYSNLAETGHRIAAAAQTSGCGLTLLPVHYQFGGLDQRPLDGGQLRFGNDMDRFARLHGDAANGLAALPADTRIGVAPHSLRAVAPRDLPNLHALAEDAPFHMHLAEQPAEVAEVTAALGLRPVQWMLENMQVDAQCTFIHCTQMQADETLGLAASGAVAGLCPLTEANLGDGTFDGVRWLGANGPLAIGSDSNIRISLAEELRQLDTSQRLRDGSRAALATPKRSAGRRLMQAAAEGGARAAGRGSGRIEAGAWADLLALDADHPDLGGLTGDTALDTFVFAGGSDMVQDVWSAGRHLVRDGQHIRQQAITDAYRRAVAALRDGL